MMSRFGFCLGLALFAALPLAAKAACDTDNARETTRIRYTQVLAEWQNDDATAYAAAQDQLHADAATAKRGGPLKVCQFQEKTIQQYHKKGQ